MILLGGGSVEMALDWETGDPVRRSLHRAIGNKTVEMFARKLAREIWSAMPDFKS